MSLLKYAEDPKICAGNGRGRLSFYRSDVDQMPFRGPVPLLREDEWEDYTEVVNDGYVELFELGNPDHKKILQRIVDASANGWYQIYKMEETVVPQPDGTVKVFVYCVWSEPCREMARYRAPDGLELRK